jgi:hypothetical protein
VNSLFVCFLAIAFKFKLELQLTIFSVDMRIATEEKRAEHVLKQT